jgi:hypothetical protein
LTRHLFIHLNRFIMKIALMILFVWGGLAINSTTAQACNPCPPACCKAASCEPGKGSASANQTQAVQNALVSFSPETMAAACEGKKMSKKEMKGCQVLCQPVSQGTCQPASAAAPVHATNASPTPVAASLTPAPSAKPIKQ